MSTRILIVEDDEQTRDLIREYLARDSTLEVVAETADGGEAVALAQQYRPHIVLMDLSLQGPDGLKATKRIKNSCPDTEVIILTSYDFEDLKERARESPQWVGSAAFLGKHEIPKRLLSVITSLIEGRKGQAGTGGE